MKIKYEIEDYRPEAEWICIKFSNPDVPDSEWYEQFTFPDFSKEKLVDHIRAVASRVAGSWTRIPDHPKELTIPLSGMVDVEPELYLPYEPNPQLEEEPEYDPWTQVIRVIEADDPRQQTLPWEVIDLTPEEQQGLIQQASYNIREERLYLLSLTDGMFTPDAPPIEEMAPWLEFRQALRDIPQQPNFPKEVVWPVRPDLAE